MRPLFRTAGATPTAAIFMSGAGSNARHILEQLAAAEVPPFRISFIFTDAPRQSQAAALAKEFRLPARSLDIRRFYADRGEPVITLNTPERRRLRDEWTDEVRGIAAADRPDFIIMAGFVPLCNIAADYPCLNVHPGDLTAERDGRRIFAGLHFKPVERAIIERGRLRSSVILVQPFSGDAAGDADAGPILGVSPEIPADLCGYTPEELRAAETRRRPGVRPDDILRQTARVNAERLKKAGDHAVFFPAILDFAAGRFGTDDRGGLLFTGDNGKIEKILTVEYSADGRRKLLLRE